MTEEQIKKIEAFNDALNHGWRVSGREVTDVYNQLMDRKVPPTNCASCIKRRISELNKLLIKEKENAQQK